MPATSRLSLPYPAGSDTPDVPRDLEALADALDHVAQYETGLLSARPAAGVMGRAYWATDERILYLDNGASWDSASPFSVPVGGLILWPSGTMPSSDWLLANGQAVSSATYPALYAVLGTTYGGDGSPNFNVPDLRGRAPVGKGANAQVDALGKSDGLADGSRRRAHKHAVTASGSGTTGSTNTDHTHSGTTGGTNESTAHDHTLGIGGYAISDGTNNSGWYAGTGYYRTTAAIASVASDSVPHTHNVTTGGMSANASHGHSFTANVTGTSGDQAGPSDNEPFLVVNFAIRAL